MSENIILHMVSYKADRLYPQVVDKIIFKIMTVVGFERCVKWSYLIKMKHLNKYGINFGLIGTVTCLNEFGRHL